MSRPEPLQPAYDFSSAPEPVSLLRGAVEVGLGNDRFAGTADLLLRFLPSPRVIFHASVQGAAESALLFVFNDPVDPSLSFNGQRVEGFYGRRKANADTLELDWHPKSEPVVLCDMQSKTSVAAILHLFNFPDFRGGQHQATAAPAGCALLVLESEEWRISLQSLPNSAIHQAWERIKDEGGCFLTHVAKLERKDGKPFSGEEACEQRLLLTNFLSFTKGGRCSTACEVGLDAAGEKTWETFASPRISTRLIRGSTHSRRVRLNSCSRCSQSVGSSRRNGRAVCARPSTGMRRPIRVAARQASTRPSSWRKPP